jgi:hypothetical protein
VKQIYFWYEKVTSDLDKIVDAISYYRELWHDGQQHLTLKGRLGTLLEEQTGILRYYEPGLIDASMIHKWLDEYIKYRKAQKRIYYTKEGRAEFGDLKKTDIDVYIASDPDIYELMQILMLMEIWVKNLENLVEGLKKRGMYVVMASKVRIAGEHDAYIDTSEESNAETIG